MEATNETVALDDLPLASPEAAGPKEVVSEKQTNMVVKMALNQVQRISTPPARVLTVIDGKICRFRSL